MRRLSCRCQARIVLWRKQPSANYCHAVLFPQGRRPLYFQCTRENTHLLSMRHLLKQLHIQTNRAHEQVNIVQTLLGHVSGQGLGHGHGVHDSVLDGKHKSLLLLWAGADTNGGQELPDVNVFSGSDSAGEDGRESRLKVVEEAVESTSPGIDISNKFSRLQDERRLTIAATTAHWQYHSA